MAISKWNKSPLKFLCNRIGDGLHGTPAYDDESDVFFINGNNLKNGTISISSETKKVNRAEAQSNHIELNDNSLLLSINGTLGEIAFYNNEKVMLGKSAAYLNFKTGINRFYYYYFQLKDVQHYFYNIATGSTIKNLGLRSIQEFEVPHPDEKEWRPIAKVLSVIDQKIELNKKINAELEAMAKLIYDYWFVQFDFPDANGKPYKSSGGKMVYNEELNREVPHGWEILPFSEFNNVKKGELITKEIAEVGKVKVVAAGQEFSYFHSSPNYKKNTITISGSGASAGFVNFWREPIFASDCITVRGASDTKTLLALHYLKLIQDYIFKQARGSAQPHVYPDDISRLMYLAPPKKLIEMFGDNVLPPNEKIAINLTENERLSELKNWLLPMLMNGQVTVNDAPR